jgi:hypothetical protein
MSNVAEGVVAVLEPFKFDRVKPTAATPSRSTRREWVDAVALVVGYLLLLAITRTVDQGDTPVYAADVVAALHGDLSAMWDFGHVLWRPIGYGFLRVAMIAAPSAAQSQPTLYVAAVYTFTFLSMAAGAAAVIFFRLWLGRLGVPRLPAAVATVGFFSAAAVVGYAQTGSSYVPALSMLVLGLYAMADDNRGHRWATIRLASVGFAGAALLWAPMVLGIPGAALSTIVLRDPTRRRAVTALLACVISGTITILAYAVIVRAAGLQTAHDIRQWVGSSSHGIVGVGGVPRAIVGFARSVVNTGQLGLIVKRHMIHDPYNATTWFDVLRGGLARLLLFYGLVAVVGVTLALRAQRLGRRVLLFLACSAAPVIGLALSWQGGDLERYLALFPALFAAGAFAMALVTMRAMASVVPAGIGAMCVINTAAITRSKANVECTQLANRLTTVPKSGTGPTLVISPHGLDEIVMLNVHCPTSPLVTAVDAPEVRGLVMSNSSYSYAWRGWLAAETARVWDARGRVWSSARAFAPVPAGNWRWAEGDDPKLHWRDFPEYFKNVDVSSPVGREDGFVELLPTERTRAFIASATGGDGRH